MGQRRIRPADCAAGVAWLLMVWLLVRAGFDGITPMHVWGLAVGAVAAAATVWAVVVSATARVERAVHRRTLKELIQEEVGEVEDAA